MAVIDQALALAFSLQNNRGGYALLLGSGVSRSAGVPTGWEIVQGLIRQLAHLKNQPTEAPGEWYEREFGRAPKYSELLAQLAGTPAERMQLLRGYFEPTAEEREKGLKLPTAAHRAIAKLVSDGYVRVIVTTNFDRLLEGALQDVGIQPTVIGSADAARGALPLVHLRCAIVKVNGDYLDSRLKNTGDELAQYEEPLEGLLNQVFDQYGVIICGWSAEWDTALRAALERCTTHRFTTYWAVRDKLGQRAQDLSVLRRATLVPITSGDEFFTEISEKVSALQSFAQTDPLSTNVAVARMKRYLADNSHRISLHDLLTAETERAHEALTGPAFPIQISNFAPSVIPRRLDAYEATVETLLNLLICGAYWGEPEHDELLVRCYKRLADQPGPRSGFKVLISLQRYPALLLLYAMGLASLSHRRYHFLRALFYLRVRETEHEEDKLVVTAVHDQAVLQRDSQKQALSKVKTPLSDRLFEILREPLRAYLPDDVEYDRTFDWFEYLLGLCHCDAGITREALAAQKKENPGFTLWASVGRFGWKHAHEGASGITAETQICAGEPLPEKVAAVIGAGFFQSSGQHEDKYVDVKAAFDRHVGLVRNNWLW